jgi:hypothetical protein
MHAWQERVTRETRPALRAEHELRYRAAAPLIVEAPVWVDLGCGTGVAAADALGNSFRGHAILVDGDGDALDDAAAMVHAGTITPIGADVADADDVERVRAAIAAAGDGGCVTCFEVIEHLSTFVPVLDLMTTLVADHGYTAVLSVANDAFWAIENPFHRTMWGEGSFEELRRLLPAEHVVARQIPLSGSAIVRAAERVDVALPDVAVHVDRVPSHFIAAFGSHAHQLVSRGFVTAADLDGERARDRERDSRLAFREAESNKLRERIVELEGGGAASAEGSVPRGADPRAAPAEHA